MQMICSGILKIEENMNKFYAFIISKKEVLKKFLPITFLRKCKWYAIQAKINSYKPLPVDKSMYSSMPLGINLIGDAQIEIGLGQSMRLIANALSLSKKDFCIIDLPISANVRRNDLSWVHTYAKEPKYNINLLHINPQDLGMSYLQLGEGVFRNRYNIGFWLWELEEVPKESLAALKFVDEIWTPSEFASNAFRKYTSKPVHTIPYYVTAEVDPTCDRKHFGLPEDKFLFLLMFDFNSTMLRKNPQCAINAFRKAFSSEDPDVGLVIKVNNPTKECMDTLHTLMDGYSNVYYITDTLAKAEVNSLIGCVDVFVSTHRAEGFGLVMAEAMLLKTACIATNWSSNTEFMNPETACMVSCDMVTIEKGEGSYPPGATWADPDVDETAMYMKKLKESPDYYQEIVEKAYDSTSALLGKEKVTNLLEKRIMQINESITEMKI